jgi:hypothetical protein
MDAEMTEVLQASATEEEALQVDKAKHEARLEERLKKEGWERTRKACEDGDCQYSSLADREGLSTLVMKETLVRDVEQGQTELDLVSTLDYTRFASVDEYIAHLKSPGHFGDEFTLLMYSRRFERQVKVLRSTEGDDYIHTVTFKEEYQSFTYLTLRDGVTPHYDPAQFVKHRCGFGIKCLHPDLSGHHLCTKTPTDKDGCGIHYHNLCALALHKSESTSWCGCVTVSAHINKRKQKEQATQREKKQAKITSFAAFNAESHIGVSPDVVAKQSSLTLGVVTTVLKEADKDLKKKEVEGKAAGGSGKEYGIVELPDQVTVVQHALRERLSFSATKKYFLKVDNKLGMALKESTVRLWKQKWNQLVTNYRSAGLSVNDAEAAAREEYVTGVKRGRPTLLGQRDHNNFIDLLKAIRASGGKVIPMVVQSIGRAVVINSGRGTELFENGGTLKLDLPWARGILDNTLGWSNRKATTDRKLTSEEAVECAREAKALEEKIEQYHPLLVLEMDETLAPWCPQDNTTYAEEGTGRVEMNSQNDKRGNTLTVTISKNEILPFHLIWDGLTDRSIPNCHWPPEFVNSFAGQTGTRKAKDGKDVKKTNKWQNRKTMKEYLNGIVKPYVERARASVAFRTGTRYPKGTRALLVMDHHWSHEEDSNEVIQPFCDDLSLDIEFVPKKATDLFSVLDVAVNKPLKSHIKNSFMLHCTEEVRKQLANGVKPANVKLDIRTSTIKPLAGTWIIDCYNTLKQKEATIIPAGWLQVAGNVSRLLSPSS